MPPTEPRSRTPRLSPRLPSSPARLTLTPRATPTPRLTLPPPRTEQSGERAPLPRLRPTLSAPARESVGVAPLRGLTPTPATPRLSARVPTRPAPPQIPKPPTPSAPQPQTLPQRAPARLTPTAQATPRLSQRVTVPSRPTAPAPTARMTPTPSAPASGPRLSRRGVAAGVAAPAARLATSATPTPSSRVPLTSFAKEREREELPRSRSRRGERPPLKTPLRISEL